MNRIKNISNKRNNPANPVNSVNPDSDNLQPFYNTAIPSGWEVKAIDEFAPLQRGFDLPVEQILEGEFPVVFSNGILKYHNQYKAKAPGVVTGRSGTIGKVTFVEKDYWPHNTTLWVTDFKKNEPMFVYYFYDHFDLERFGSGSGVPTLNRNDVHRQKIIIPPLPEQKAIAHILSLMDTAINKNNLLIAKKELQKKWLMQNLLTGKKRLKGFKDEWNKIGAGEIFKSITIKGFDSEELLSATQDRGMIPRTMLEGRVTMPTSGTEGFKLVEKGDFIISLRSFQGGLEYSYYRGLVSPAYTVLKPKKKINDEFYKSYFKSYDFIGHLAVAVIGIRDGKQISYEDFCFVKIPFPSYEEQTAIAQVLQAADKEIQLLKTKTEKLKEQKKGLMQVLLTGKKRLKQGLQN